MSLVVPLLSSRDVDLARRLVESQGLTFEEPFDDIIGIFEAGRLVATAARSGDVLKMFAIDERSQGGALLGELATELVRLGTAAGRDALFVFTRPEHAQGFEQLHFRLLVTDGPVALLEHGAGLERYLASTSSLVRPGRNGAVVINGNPFTLGHLYLVETAAARVDTLYLFVVREDRSVFPFDARIRLAREATAQLSNVVVLDTSRYAVSASIFPSYFLKRCDEAAVYQMRIDARLFGAHLAPAFGVSTRFVGQEPLCETTSTYNGVMKSVLPEHGVALVEVARRELSGAPISATRVRAALARGDIEATAPLVPQATLAYLRSPEGLAVAARLGRPGTRS